MLSCFFHAKLHARWLVEVVVVIVLHMVVFSVKVKNEHIQNPPENWVAWVFVLLLLSNKKKLCLPNMHDAWTQSATLLQKYTTNFIIVIIISLDNHDEDVCYLPVCLQIQIFSFMTFLHRLLLFQIIMHKRWIENIRGKCIWAIDSL